MGSTSARRPVGGALAFALLLGGLLAACGETAREVRVERDLHDPVPRTRLAAVREVARSRDPAHVPDLIEMLDDEDECIRLLAGASLKEITGRDTGYEAHASPSARREQVLDWRRWWAGRSGAGASGGAVAAPPACGVAPAPSRPTPPPPPPPPRAGGSR